MRPFQFSGYYFFRIPVMKKEGVNVWLYTKQHMQHQITTCASDVDICMQIIFYLTK